MNARSRIAALDGLRLIAAVSVVVHHAAAQAGPAHTKWFGTYAAVGDVGVAVFFVLSGLVIWRPFSDSIRGTGPKVAALPFLRRRIVRIVPAYWVALTFFWMVGAFDIPSWSVGLRLYLLGETTSPGSLFRGIVPAWTLTVELSFYLIVPLIAAFGRWVTGKIGDPRRAELMVIAGLAAIGPVSRWAFTALDRTWDGEPLVGMAFTWLPTSIDIFAAGMAIAALTDRIPATWFRRTWTWWTAALLVIAAYARFVGTPDFEVGYTGWWWQLRQLVYLSTGVLMIAPLALGRVGAGSIRRLTASAPMVFLGTISYGLYLYHFDWIRLIARDAASPAPGMDVSAMGSGPGNMSFLVLLVGGLTLGGGCAVLSWFLVERPTAALWRPRGRGEGSAGE